MELKTKSGKKLSVGLENWVADFKADYREHFGRPVALRRKQMAELWIPKRVSSLFEDYTYGNYEGAPKSIAEVDELHRCLNEWDNEYSHLANIW